MIIAASRIRRPTETEARPVVVFAYASGGVVIINARNKERDEIQPCGVSVSSSLNAVSSCLLVVMLACGNGIGIYNNEPKSLFPYTYLNSILLYSASSSTTSHASSSPNPPALRFLNDNTQQELPTNSPQILIPLHQYPKSHSHHHFLQNGQALRSSRTREVRTSGRGRA